MKFLDARVRLQHPCPFCDLSSAFPKMEVSSWCNVDNEVIQMVASDGDQLKEAVEWAKKALGVKQVISGERSVLAITSRCLCTDYNTISTIADRCNSWSVPPTIYFGGWETHRIISHCKADLKRFAEAIRKVGKIEVISLKERDQLDMLNSLGVVPIHFFEGLTNKQLRIIVSAYESGLLEVPAKTRMDRVAKTEGLSRSTYGEHLRKAVFRIVQNAYPVLKLYDEGAGTVSRRT
jgi:hypothetical protein